MRHCWPFHAQLSAPMSASQPIHAPTQVVSVRLSNPADRRAAPASQGWGIRRTLQRSAPISQAIVPFSHRRPPQPAGPSQLDSPVGRNVPTSSSPRTHVAPTSPACVLPLRRAVPFAALVWCRRERQPMRLRLEPFSQNVPPESTRPYSRFRARRFVPMWFSPPPPARTFNVNAKLFSLVDPPVVPVWQHPDSLVMPPNSDHTLQQVAPLSFLLRLKAPGRLPPIAPRLRVSLARLLPARPKQSNLNPARVESVILGRDIFNSQCCWLLSPVSFASSSNQHKFFVS
jgi:hypothetical protein